MEGRMVRRTDRPLQIVRVSFERTRFSAQHLIDAYACLVPTVRRSRTAPARGKVGRPQVQALMAKRRRGEAWAKADRLRSSRSYEGRRKRTHSPSTVRSRR